MLSLISKNINDIARNLTGAEESLPQLYAQMKDAIKKKDLKEIENLFEKIVKKSGVVIPKREPSKKDLELQAAFLTVLKALGRHDKDIEDLDEDINWEGKFDLYLNLEKSVNPEILKNFEVIAKLLNFSVIAPSEGDRYDPKIHLAHSEEDSTKIPRSRIIRCHVYGYKDSSGLVRRRAHVILSRPPR